MGDMQFNGTPEEWDALVKKNRETTQTATQWLIEEIHKNMGVWIPPHIQDQAKAMEKEQIIDAYWNGTVGMEKKDALSEGEKFYNIIYSK